MTRSLLLFFCAALRFAGAAQPPAVPVGLNTAIESSLHRVTRTGDFYVAYNHRQHLGARFVGGKTAFVHRESHFSLSLTGRPAAPARPIATGNRIDISHGNITEWFINDAAGLEHGFTVASRPAAAGPLVLSLDVTGDYRPVLEHSTIVLRPITAASAEMALHYGGLASWDATGRPLPSRAEVVHNRIRLVVDDAGAQYPVTVDPIFQEPAIQASNGATGDNFGYSVAISGDTAVVGAPFAWTLVQPAATDPVNSVPKLVQQGAVYVFIRSGGAWVEQAKLPSPPTSVTKPVMNLGHSVAISGDTVVVGTPYDALPVTGAAYVYTRSGTSWTLQQRLIGTDTILGDQFGWSVAVDGETVVVGANRKGGILTGAAYAFVRTGVTWTQQMKFVPAPGTGGIVLTSNYGVSVGISGDTVVIGGDCEEVFNSSNLGGVAEVFVREGSSWFRQIVLGAPEWLPTLPNASSWKFGHSVAIHRDTVVVGAPGVPSTGAVYFFTRSGVNWTAAPKVTASDAQTGHLFGSSVSLLGDLAVAGAPGASNGIGAAYLFSRNGANWFERRLTLAVPPSTPIGYGSAVAIGGSSILITAPAGNANKGEAYPFRLQNVALQSSPTGRSFTLTGNGCGATGTFATPYAGFWGNCTVQWVTPAATDADTRHTFQTWADGFPTNSRSLQFTSDISQPIATYTGNFLTEYFLTTQALPSSGGAVTGSGWYASGTNAAVAALPNAGFVFTGFSGGLGGVVTPQNILMNRPKTATGSFTTTPPAVLSGIVSAKSGAANSRNWNIALTNNGPGVAYNAQLFVLMFVQTFGTPCTALPVRLAPALLPASLGTLAAGNSAQIPVTLDFSGCPANARFTVNLGYMSNGGASGGVISLVNQFQ